MRELFRTISGDICCNQGVLYAWSVILGQRTAHEKVANEFVLFTLETCRGTAVSFLLASTFHLNILYHNPARNGSKEPHAHVSHRNRNRASMGFDDKEDESRDSLQGGSRRNAQDEVMLVNFFLVESAKHSLDVSRFYGDGERFHNMLSYEAGKCD